MIPGSANSLLLGQTGGGFSIERSLRFNSGDSGYIQKSFASSGNRKTWTLSFWVKLNGSTGHLISAGNDAFQIELRSDGQYLIANSGCFGNTYSTAVFRDYSAWQHFVIEHDATNTYCKIYINGSLQKTITASNADGAFNHNTPHNFNGRSTSLDSFTDFYLAEVNFIDGQALTPTNFGETDDNGVWQAIDTAGLTFGTNGFRLQFADNSGSTATTLGKDTSGNSNNWTPNNLSTSTPGLATANQGFDVVAYTGNGSTRSISSLNFSPDLVWFKNRGTTNYHQWHDRVRGPLKRIYSNSSDAENNYTTALTSFDSNGWTMGNGTPCNASGNNYVAWCWKAGGTASSNSNGTITSSVSANASHGFSIVSYNSGSSTGNYTLGHGLSSAPKFIIHKSRASGNWWAYHASVIDNTSKYLQLNSTNAIATNSAPMWGASLPTSSVFGVRVGDLIGTNTDTIAYCWSEVAGFSKFGSYSGGTNPKTITTGFKPIFLMFKRTDSANHWILIDSARGGTQKLAADLNVTENDNASIGDASQNIVEFSADGFKLTTTNSATNVSGGTYIYMALAAQPDSSAIDSLVDTPTNGDTASDTGLGNQITGNYATFNPLENPIVRTPTFSNGNLQVVGQNQSAQYSGCMVNFGFTSGKYYCEFTYQDKISGFWGVGIIPQSELTALGRTTSNNYGLMESANSRIYMGSNGAVYSNSGTIVTGLPTFAEGDVIGLAVDFDAGKMWVSKNGTYPNSGNPATGANATTTFTTTYAPWRIGINLNNNDTIVLNSGQRAFNTAAPSGYKSLNTANLPTPTIADGSKYFDTKLYTGSGAARSITMDNSEMSPDFVWLKARNDAADHHHLFDKVRGAGKRIFSNLTNAESTDNNTLSSFDSNGFSLGTQTAVNGNGDSMVGWVWDAGSSNTTIAAGSLNSSLYNQAETWNSQVTGTSQTYDFGGGGKRGNNYMFDGNIKHSTAALGAAPGANIIWSGSIAFSTSFAIANENDGASSAINITHGAGNTVTNVRSQVPNTSNSQLAAGTVLLTTLTGITSPVTKIELVSSSSAANGITQVVADGKMLVDSSITLAAVPSITSQVMASPESGFSIVKFTGVTWNGSNPQTIGHGLNAAPKMIILKNIDRAVNWAVYHKSIGNTTMLQLNTTGGKEGNDSGYWNNTTPTSSVFSVGNGYGYRTGGINEAFSALCFAPVAGYSAMGSYVGNGSADGPFVFTGFKVAWLMVKNTTTSGETWTIYDAVRDPHNLATNRLQPNDAAAESSGTAARDKDLLSNGFKIRGGSGEQNTSGNTYIYLAFASNPFASNGGLAR